MSQKKPLPPYLEDLKQLIAADHNQFIAEVTTMDWNSLHERPIAGVWSVLEIVEHIRQAEEVVGQIIEEMVVEGEKQGLMLRREPDADYLAALTFDLHLAGDQFCSPREILPTGQADMATLLQELSQCRAKTLELLPRMAKLDLIAITRDHPHLGPLHLFHWVRLLGLHQERHLDQIHQIRQALDH